MTVNVNDRDRRIARLKEAAQRKHEDARAKANRALMALEAKGAAINFRAVADAARVSKDFLYSQADLAARIREARTTRSGVPAVPAGERLSSEGALVQLAVIKTANEVLRREVEDLRRENAALRGELIKLRRSSV